MLNRADLIAQIRKTLAELPAECCKPWVNLDSLPYLHAVDDPKASPWGSPVVGRFDYLPTMDYIKACNPAAMAVVLEEPQEEVLWNLLNAVTEEMNRRAVPGAWLTLAYQAGSKFITARRAKEDPTP